MLIVGVSNSPKAEYSATGEEKRTRCSWRKHGIGSILIRERRQRVEGSAECWSWSEKEDGASVRQDPWTVDGRLKLKWSG